VLLLDSVAIIGAWAQEGNMGDIILFHSPGACSRVTMNALEEIGLAYEDRAVNLAAGEQKSAAYLAVNPKAKVPALKIGTRVHTENAAIVNLLHVQHPAARLLPAVGNGVEVNEGLEDLVWCSSTVHPLVRQVRMPSRYTDGDTSGVKANGMKNLPLILAQVAERLSADRWWYGAQWSIIDVYLYWNYSTAQSGGLDLSIWPALQRHADRVRQRPSFARALAREQAALARHNLSLPPGATL
jgi:glutathione S-transferase